jgi:PTH1 family peptidyl-tRNA hydrolase
VKLVVGLGNPGRRYASTRHNVGFRVAERFARSHGIALSPDRCGGRFGSGIARSDGAASADVGVLLPERYMNRSGEVLAEALRAHPVEDPSTDVIVVFDDVDLPFGRLRVRPSGRSAGHRGLENVIECLGSQQFPRLRFGIGHPAGDVETTDYVLADFSEAESVALDDCMGNAVAALDTILFEGLVPAMNAFNRQESADR